MQGSPSQSYFVELAATFTLNGDQITLRAEEFEPNDQHGFIYTDGPGWRLEGATAIVVGGHDRFNLSHVCSGPDAPSTTAQPTTSLPVTTTTTRPSTTIEPTTTLGLGGATTTTGGGGTSITIGGATTTTGAAGSTTTPVPPTTTTIEASTTATEQDGATTTIELDGATTTESGTAGAGQTTAPGGDAGGASTTGDVAGSDVLPETGSSESPTAGLAGLLTIAGLVLLSVARRTSAHRDR